jgi:Spy/CpxP family protein refolding chaperone
MRILKISALALACVAGGLAFSQANAAPDMPKGPQGWIERMCSADAKGDKMASHMEKRVARMATILQLNDAQKATLKDLEDARAKQRADFKTSLCAKKPDLSTFPNRLAFREQMMQHRLDALKAETPKLIAFYNSLDDKQKAAFEEMRGAMMGGHHPMMGRGPGGRHGMGPGGHDGGDSGDE